MRRLFAGYYTPTEEEFARLWRDGIFSLDANILLHSYRYPASACELLFKIIEALGERVWITHQAALEYQENRPEVITEQRSKVYDTINEGIEKASAQIVSSMPRHHPHLNRSTLIGFMMDAANSMRSYIEEAKKQHPATLTSDDLHYRLGDLLTGKVGTSYPADQLIEHRAAAAARYKLETPPGYMDQKSKEKPAPECYGDYIIWRQLLDHAKEKKDVPFVFVTDDDKVDWWRVFNGQTLGPRPELIQEFRHETGGGLFWMYRGDRFIDFAQKHLGDKIHANTEEWTEAVEAATAVREEKALRDDETTDDITPAQAARVASALLLAQLPIDTVDRSGSILRAETDGKVLVAAAAIPLTARPTVPVFALTSAPFQDRLRDIDAKARGFIFVTPHLLFSAAARSLRLLKTRGAFFFAVVDATDINRLRWKGPFPSEPSTSA